MANQRRSVATIDSPEFINITSISPLVSQCEIKVFYVGQNRNQSYISKEVAREMAQTLPGCPIVGYYLENKEDFGDHGHQMIIDGEGIKFNTLTKPYGFVAPDSKVWFQKFEDTDDFGNVTVREYLMTEGYIWTEQYEEAKRIIDKGNPHSMELDEKTLKGHWSTDVNRGIDFFIINDAIVSKLCVLGEDVEPCFEGSSITAPNISASFSKDDNFTKSLFKMMNELKFTLNNKEGGPEMAKENENFSLEQDNVSQNASLENQNTIEDVENFSLENTQAEESQNVEDEFAKKDEEDKKDADSKEDEKEESSDDKDEEDKEDDKKKDDYQKSCGSDDDENKKKYALMEQELAELKNQYSLLEAENKELKEFKQEVENKEKDALIESFYMLSDEDKKDVIENKANYSLKEIKAELSMICVDKKVNFNLEESKEEKEVAVTFNLNNSTAEIIPAWVQAVKNVENK